MRGIGLHGHITTSKAKNDAERADVFRRAQEFSDKIQTESVEGLSAALAEANKRIAELEAAAKVRTLPPPPPAPRRR